jgi:hypothetical protein
MIEFGMGNQAFLGFLSGMICVGLFLPIQEGYMKTHPELSQRIESKLLE